MEERGKRCAIRLNQRVIRIEHVELRRAIVGIDGDLDAVTNVIDGSLSGPVVTRIRIIPSFREGIHDPVEPPII